MLLSQEHVSELWCLACTLLFGLSWVGGKEAMNLGIGPLTFNGLRFTGSAIFLLMTRPVLKHYIHSDVHDGDAPVSPAMLRIQRFCRLDTLLSSDHFEMLWFGVLTGVSGFVGLCLQQVSLVYITATTAGFITSLFVIATPVFEYILQPIVGFEADVSGKTWLAAIVSLLGMSLLTNTDDTKADMSLATSDIADMLGITPHIYGIIVIFISMLFISLEILVCDVASKRVDCIDLTVAMFVVVALCSVATAVLLEPDQWLQWPMFPQFEASGHSGKAWLMVLSVSITEGSGYTAAALGQMYTNPSRAAIIFTMEGVMTALLSYLLLDETLDMVEALGCMLVFGATLATSATTATAHVDVKPPPEKESLGVSDRVGAVNESTPLLF